MNSDSNTATKEKKNPETLLRNGQAIEMSPHGWSMYPLIVPGRDRVVIEPSAGKKLKRLDIVLFRRDGSILVLHRIARIRKNKYGHPVYFMVGDNQSELEGPIKEDCICGVVTGLVRKGKKMSVSGIAYRSSVRIWMALRPLRPLISRGVSKVKKCFK